MSGFHSLMLSSLVGDDSMQELLCLRVEGSASLFWGNGRAHSFTPRVAIRYYALANQPNTGTGTSLSVLRSFW